MPITGDVGFNPFGGTPTPPTGCQCSLDSTDGTVTITGTTTGFNISVEEVDICELMKALPDNGLVIGG